MIVVDVEASGVNPNVSSLLSVGAVDFSNPGNRFYEECRIFDGAHIEDEALIVSGFSRTAITDTSKKTDGEVITDFLAWLQKCPEWTLAGQNISFDRDYLMYTAHRYHINWPLAHRTIDLHSVAYYHMIKRGIEPPVRNNHSAVNLDTIMKYTGMEIERGKHNALEDALLTAEAISRLFYDKGLLPEYEKYQIPWLSK
ncbi:MAG: 3'-5' exoribonuclease [Candidatus Taylorbacteria bacterium]|nr:3'-5' exoribonuclease [Candidatus Taylorbacteria bacterium]